MQMHQLLYFTVLFFCNKKKRFGETEINTNGLVAGVNLRKHFFGKGAQQ